MLKDLILKNRSYRRFLQDPRPDTDLLEKWINCARLSPSARNDQPLKYIIINDQLKCKKLFPDLAWAGYLKDWDGPSLHERPTAYILMLQDKNISRSCETDSGIACQSILLAAVEDGFGGCILGAIDRKTISADFKLPEHFDILYVIAVGKPAEEIILENNDLSQEYYRDNKGIHHVPKRLLKSIIIKI